MMNPFKEVQWNPNLAERRKFALSLIIGFPCLALVWLLVGRWRVGAWNLQAAMLLAGIGAGVGLGLFLLPRLARPFYVAWYFIACCIGLVVGNLLLAIVFYLFLGIVGCAMRLFGRRALIKTPDRKAASYWQDAEQPEDPRRYYSQY